MNFYTEKKIHQGRAIEVCWFGYRGNGHVLRSAVPALRKNKLNLSIISDDLVTVCDYGNEDYKPNERWTRWNLETCNDEIIKSDIVIMPGSTNPKFKYKSNNKIVASWLLGMPVAQHSEDLERFLDPEVRQKEADKNYEIAKRDYEVKLSVEEYKKVIEECYGRRKAG